MKINLLVFVLIALLATGCNTENKVVENPVGDNPVGENPGDNPGDENPGDNPGDTPPPVAVQKKGWYLRTVATAKLPDGRTFKHNSAGVFGELDESEAGKDRHDISSYGKAILQVRFVNKKIDNDSEYFSDYRHYDGQNKKEVWTFLVKNEYSVDLSNAALKIDVEKMRDVFKKVGESPYIEEIADKNDDKRQQLVLVDVDNQQTYSYDELETANLTMDGKHTRTFRWVLGSVDSSDMQPLSSTEIASASEKRSARSLSRKIHSDFTPGTAAGTSKFGTPPE